MGKNYTQDVGQYRKTRNRKTLIRRCAVLAVLIAVSVAIALGSDLISDIYRLVDSKFPITFVGERLQNFARSGNSFIAVSDRQYMIYSDSGERISAAPHGFATPLISLSGENAVLYEAGGSNITLIENRKEKFQKTLTETIVSADVSNSGTFGIIVKDERYLSAFTVYDKGGNEKFRYSCADQLVSVKLAHDGKKAVLAALRSQEGILHTVVTGLNFSKEDPTFEFTVENSICLGLYKTNGGWSLLCDNKILFFDDNGMLTKEYELAEKTLAWAVSDTNNAKTIAVAVWRHGAYRIVKYSKDEEAECSAFSDEPRAIAIADGFSYALTDSNVYMFDKDGKEKNKAALEEQANAVVAVKNSAYAVSDYKVSKVKF